MEQRHAVPGLIITKINYPVGFQTPARLGLQREIVQIVEFLALHPGTTNGEQSNLVAETAEIGLPVFVETLFFQVGGGLTVKRETPHFTQVYHGVFIIEFSEKPYHEGVACREVFGEHGGEEPVLFFELFECVHSV